MAGGKCLKFCKILIFAVTYESYCMLFSHALIFLSRLVSD